MSEASATSKGGSPKSKQNGAKGDAGPRGKNKRGDRKKKKKPKNPDSATETSVGEKKNVPVPLKHNRRDSTSGFPSLHSAKTVKLSREDKRRGKKLGDAHAEMLAVKKASKLLGNSPISLKEVVLSLIQQKVSLNLTQGVESEIRANTKDWKENGFDAITYLFYCRRSG